jgi:hypothetical protein
MGTRQIIDKLTNQLSKRKDVRDPAALAAWIGKKKLGKKKFLQLALTARRK